MQPFATVGKNIATIWRLVGAGHDRVSRVCIETLPERTFPGGSETRGMPKSVRLVETSAEWFDILANSDDSLKVRRGDQQRLMRLLVVLAFLVACGAVAGYFELAAQHPLQGALIGTVLGSGLCALIMLAIPVDRPRRLSDGYRLLLSAFVGLLAALAVGLLLGTLGAHLFWWAIFGTCFGIAAFVWPDVFLNGTF